MAMVESEYGDPGTQVQVAIGTKRADATVVKLPFYKRSG